MLLDVQNLEVRYPNGALGVTNSSLKVDHGQIVVLFGANGAGKTTTLRAISGFLSSEGARTTSGRVIFDGQDMTNALPEQTAERGVAIVAEREKIFPNLTVKENLLSLGTKQLGKNRDEKLERVFNLFPILREKLRQSAGRLSGGQRQMLALGRAMMIEPRLLLIDEVTLGIHPSVHPVLYGAIRKIADGGTSVLLVDESAASALEVVDYCYVMSRGELANHGQPEQFNASDLLAVDFA